MLPVEPKLGKMLILGAIFNCLDPVMTVVAGLSVRDPFLMPFDKKDVSIPFFVFYCSFLFLLRFFLFSAILVLFSLSGVSAYLALIT